jgi:acyl-CoA reductase-like NAD-dependent aldehyde dehydrogenase
MNIQNFINGKFENPIRNDWVDNYCPAIGEVYGQIPNSSKADVEHAYQAAKDAFPNWSQTTLEVRSRILIKISELLEVNLLRLAEAESKDNGKPVNLAKAIDIPRAASNFRFFGKCSKTHIRNNDRKIKGKWFFCFFANLYFGCHLIPIKKWSFVQLGWKKLYVFPQRQYISVNAH